MILQRDERLRKEIQEEGCYFMSILFLVNKHTNIKLSPEFINQVFEILVSVGAMSSDCYILDPEAIFQYLNLPVKYTDQHEGPSRVCGPDEIEILYFFGPAGGHFVVGDGKGNVAYDPWGISRAVTEGRLVSKRIFRVVK
jgi:hypothetical protein